LVREAACPQAEGPSLVWPRLGRRAGCSFLANVASSTTATAAAGQTCTEFTGGDTEVLTLQSYSFTVSGNTAGESATGVLTDQTDPASRNVSANATYSRI
jgi:hypothetical protein